MALLEFVPFMNIILPVEYIFLNFSEAWNNLPQSCETVDPNTAETGGVYLIHHKEIQRVMRLTCDVETDGGGWTVSFKPSNLTMQIITNNLTCITCYGNMML